MVSSGTEFHDSTVGAIEQSGSSTVVTFQRAYVHKWERKGGKWVGSGWAQSATVTVEGANPAVSKVGRLPARLADGFVKMSSALYENLVPAPLDVRGDVLIHLEFADGRTLDLSGVGVAVELLGQAEFVEDLPEDMGVRHAP